tara:strand:+ start:159 stop:386 length:228 start_codon:yes stop_codon:yes gene_type:complete
MIDMITKMNSTQKLYLFLSPVFLFFAFANLILWCSKDHIFLGVLLFFNFSFQSYACFVTAMRKNENEKENENISQ